MRTSRIFFFFSLVALILSGTAQMVRAKEDILQHLLAPGEFSTFHKFISGINNCSRCHILGKGISSQKCLDCHREIHKRRELKKGFHGVVRGNCVDCHKEHSGPVIVFNRQTFAHRQAAFQLEGAHKTVPCKKCHLQTEKKTGKKRFTYLGLATRCEGCHENPHEKRLSACERCHTPLKWQIPHFSHNGQTGYKLVGLHNQVPCRKCHPELGKKQRSKLRFSLDISRQCLSCHRDQHRGQLSSHCLSCHTMNGWQKVNYDHSKGKFPVLGAHKKLSCKACHQDPQVKNVPVACGSCHKKTPHNAVHTPCRNCHSQESWQQLQKGWQKHREMHSTFRYPLRGAHVRVDCGKCHEARSGKAVYFNMAFQDCGACHQDKHQGRLSPPCSRCHQVDSFKNLARFDHQQTPFPLAELHKTVACNKCHPENVYRKTPRRCFRCHLDIARFSRGFYKRISMGLASPKANIVRCTGCHETKVIDPRVTGKTCTKCHEDAYREFFIQWRQQFVRRLDAMQRDIRRLKACQKGDADLADLGFIEETLRFLRKDFEHNYRFSAALLESLGREVVDIRHENCEN